MKIHIGKRDTDTKHLGYLVDQPPDVWCIDDDGDLVARENSNTVIVISPGSGAAASIKMDGAGIRIYQVLGTIKAIEFKEVE